MTGPSKADSGIVLALAQSDQRICLESLLRQLGYAYTLAAVQGTGDIRTCSHDTGSVAVVITSLAGCDADGTAAALQAVRQLRRHYGEVQVLLLIEPDTDVSTCCQAISAGVSGFLEWKGMVQADRLDDALRQALGRHARLREEQRQLRGREIFDVTGIAGQSRAMARLLVRVRQAAMVSDAPVLILGESGTGKQLLAEAIHKLDPKRHKHPFVAVNCAAITGTLAESALFGHRKGAFTGATEDRQGYFRAANGGTLLLDEIGELEAPLQPKLLRVLQENRVMPVGDDREYPVDIRVIAASNRPMADMVAEKTFRLDLYQRLNVIRLTIPPLRQRREDIPLLFQYFLHKYAHYYRGGTIEHTDPRVYEVIGAAAGTGNVRELENLVRQILVFKTSGDTIGLEDLPEAVLRGAHLTVSDNGDTSVNGILREAVSTLVGNQQMDLPTIVQQFERLLLTEAVRDNHATADQLAHRLGVSRRTLYNKLRKHNVQAF